jgi:dihydroorotate dehydrogenase
MGFNNRGAADAVSRVSTPREVCLGINIGKTKVVPESEAAADYAKSARLLGAHADYVVVNVSSPNTPGLRDLQSTERLRPILETVRRTLDEVSPSRRVPLLVKIAPDLADVDIDAVAELALELGLDGILATNTTIGRDRLRTPADEVAKIGAGGLSGAPVKARALAVLRRLHAKVGSRLLLIGVGGIETGADAFERIRAGATLVQVYTAMIYEGPGFVARVGRELAAVSKAAGFANVSDAIGTGVTEEAGDRASATRDASRPT